MENLEKIKNFKETNETKPKNGGKKGSNNLLQFSKFQTLNSNLFSKGITLIALVVTIVILLILAAITINLVLAEGGLFERAQKAGIEQRKAEVLDQLTLAEADVSISVKPIGKPTIREYLKYVYEKGIAVEQDEDEVEKDKEYNIYTEDGLVFNIKIKEGTNVNDILINYEGTADNLPIRIYTARITIDEQTGLGKVEVALRRAENGASYTYLYKEKDATTDYIGTEGNGTGTTFTYESLTLGKTYLFKAIVDEKETEPIEVTVNQPVTELTLDKTTLIMPIGGKISLTAKISPENASNQILEWTSSDKSVATVDETGKITAIKAGTTIISVKATDGSNKEAKCNVTVKPQSTLSKLLEEKPALTANRTVRDIYENQVVVPTGFTIVDANETAVDYKYTTVITEPSVQDGVVIQDSEGNQFVWVPVGDIKNYDGKTTTITLGRYSNFTMGEDGTLPTPVQEAINYTSIVTINTYYQELISQKNTTIAYNLEEWLNSTIDNGGYYIARYEASYEIDGKANSKPSKGTPSSSAGSAPTTEGQLWNWITQPNAAIASRAMYPESVETEYYSDLVNSYAWDTAIVFIQAYSGQNTYASQKSIYIDTTSPYQPANTGERGESATIGANTTDKVCNIYDMASNMMEWTTETANHSASKGVDRGGKFNSDFYSSYRSWPGVSAIWGDIGFRALLCVKSDTAN